MKKTASRPRGYVTFNGNVLCCLNGQFIYINLKGEYLPANYEKEKLVPINNIEWSAAKKWGRELIILTPGMIIQVQNALIEREKFFEKNELAFNFISAEDIAGLCKLKPDVMFMKIIHWCKFFTCTPENQGFRDRIGFKLFGLPFCLVNRLNPTQKDEVVKAYRIFNSTPSMVLNGLMLKVNTKPPTHKWKGKVTQ